MTGIVFTFIVVIAAKDDCAWCVAEIGVAVAGCIAAGLTEGAAIIACVSGIIGAGIYHNFNFSH